MLKRTCKLMLKKSEPPPSTLNHNMCFSCEMSFQSFNNTRFHFFFLRTCDVTKKEVYNRGLEKHSFLTLTRTCMQTSLGKKPSWHLRGERDVSGTWSGLKELTWTESCCLSHSHMHTHNVDTLIPSMTMLYWWRDRAAYLMTFVSESEEAAGYDPFICMLITEHIGPGTSGKISP